MSIDRRAAHGGAAIERSHGEVRGLIGWLTTTDHKRIGLLYISTSFVFFLRRRRAGRW